jgi:Na+/H+ antiporter NhaD/arsenite permease-like protein
MLVPAVFVLTYVGMALGRVPGLKIDRSGIALMGVAVLLAGGAIAESDLGRWIDGATLILLLALMIVSAQFAAAGFYDACARRVMAASGGPAWLLLVTVVVAGGLSAVLANDIVVYAMTPLICLGTRARGLDPRPFVIALAGACNAGSAATVIGNPQNILIGQVGRLDFWAFLVACGVPALLSLPIVFAVVWWLWRDRWHVVGGPPSALPPTPLDRWQTGKGVVATGALLVLFATSLPREVGALAIAAALLASRRLASRELIGAVDWHLLLLFACLFIVTGAFAQTGLAGDAIASLQAHGLMPDRLSVMTPLALVASNTIGNVPTVILLLAVWPEPPVGALYGLALLSTLAGNLLLVGSLANLIAVERAAVVGVRLSFAEHAQAGIPMTIATMGLGAGWLWMTGWMV